MHEQKVVKKWGLERWLHNDQKYCMKVLEINPGYQSSMHFHRTKEETFLVVQGKIKLEVMPHYRRSSEVRDVVKRIYLQPFQAYTLEPYTPHRFTAIGGRAIVVEASMRHDDGDVVRLEESKQIER